MTLLKGIFSMTKNRPLITIASWEERFRLGTERIVQGEQPTALLMFYYREYAERSSSNRNRVKELCAAHSIRLDEVEVSFDPVAAWRKYEATVYAYQYINSEVLLDFTTAPREAI